MSQDGNGGKDINPASLTAGIQETCERNSFPQSWQGRWHCETTVTTSAVASIQSGSKLVSNIEFSKNTSGKTIARWNQAGWTETEASITSFNSRESMIDRTSYYYGEGLKGAWATRSRDKFSQVEPDRILSISYVDQYIDGHYLGRYRTKSVMTRIHDDHSLALTK